MKAIYAGKLYTVVDEAPDDQVVLVWDRLTSEGTYVPAYLSVPFGDPRLVIDPTDDEAADALYGYIEAD